MWSRRPVASLASSGEHARDLGHGRGGTPSAFGATRDVIGYRYVTNRSVCRLLHGAVRSLLTADGALVRSHASQRTFRA